MKTIYIILFSLFIILLSLIFLIIIYSKSDKKGEKGEKGEKEIEKFDSDKIIKFDFVIIGGGITGTYLAYSLKKKFPNKSILLIEKNVELGGRLSSVNIDKISLEYGGMRFFEEIHPRLISLLKELNINKIHVPYKEHENIYNLRGEIFRRKNLFPNSEKKYFIRKNEKNTNIFQEIDKRVKNNLSKYIKTDHILDYNTRLAISKDNKLSTITFNSIILNGKDSFSIENWQRYLDIFGYKGLYNREESFLSGCVENYSLISETQYFIQGGTQGLVKSLVQDFKIIDEIKQLNNNKINKNSVILNTVLLRTEVENNSVNCYLLNMKNYKEEVIINTKKLYICTRLSDYEAILNSCNKCSIVEQSTENYIRNCQELLTTIKDNLDTYSLTKIFLYYKNNWWSKITGVNRGRNITTDKLNQVWFYDDNYIMIYSSLEDADYWNSNFPYNEQKELVDANTNIIKSLNILLQEKLEAMFSDFGIEIPLADKIGWKYWEEGYAQWTNIRTHNSKYKNIDEVKNKLRYPFENIDITYINNDTSLNQGWIEGSLEEVDDVLADGVKSV